jgi:ribosome biogenesis GTPase
MQNDIKNIGWSEKLAHQAKELSSDKKLFPARITEEQKNFFKLHDGKNEFWSKLSGKFFLDAVNRIDLPAVGDWVLARKENEDDEALIEFVLPRKTTLIRKVSGKVIEEQIIATNIDIVFIFMSLNQDFNLRRLERYIALVHSSNAKPIIILSKTDLVDDYKDKLEQVKDIAQDIEIIPTSKITGENISLVKDKIKKGITVSLIGSSGVGKSSMINAIVGEEILKTKEIRKSDDKGVHTTTARSMIFLPNAGMIIDTPGIREVHLWEEDESLEEAYNDIEEIALNCKFRDCTHQNEPNCAVKQAVKDGILEEKRYQNYVKLKNEVKDLKQKQGKMKIFKEGKANRKAAKFNKKMRKKQNEARFLKGDY